MAITKIRIFPSIGVARLGNSPTDFFVGPEIPGVHTPPAGGYKDAHCRIKRQAARFRLYGYDENDALVKEITAADAQITWTVHLANTKSAFREFDGLDDDAPLRNVGVPNRDSLKIDPGPRSLTAPGQAAGFNTGTFLNKVVPLGEMRTEADGRLLVLGGFGGSGSVPAGLPLPSYANNDGWHDDVSDGPVRASVTLNGAMVPIEALPSWVLCVPTDFAPPVENLTTLYDVLRQVAVDTDLLPPPGKPTFTQDILPILRRTLRLGRVTKSGANAHAGALPDSFPPGATKEEREAVFKRLRDPENLMGEPEATMPLLFDDNNSTFLALTRLQYNDLERWKDGDFTDDSANPPPPPGSVTPDGLTRAALEACVGAAFFPGIEVSWSLRDTYAYSEPFRLDPAGRAPGDATRQMAVPWQADFMECMKVGQYAWWPAQRPDQVFPEAGGGPVEWTRDFIAGNDMPALHKAMVDNWQRLGFIVEKGGQLVETERHVVCRNLFLITDRSHFSADEVAGTLLGGVPAKFPQSFYVVAEGFLPSELGVTTSTPSPGQLEGMAPPVEIRRTALDGELAPGLKAVARTLLLQDDTLPPTLRQRITFGYDVEFADAASFSFGGDPVESQEVTLTASKPGFSATGRMTLFHQPNPYMLDGPASWLSTDVRVFQVTEGQSPFGPGVGAMGNDPAAATAFVTKVVQHFNTAPDAGHPFAALAEAQGASVLELSQKVGGKRVFNFAVARVRYRAAVLDAPDVRVFFRMFTTAATGLDYDVTSTYRRSAGAAPISLLGLQGGKLVTLPFYGDARKDTAVHPLTAQEDALNRRTLLASGQDEFRGYFACWLDFNQPTPRFPAAPSPMDGPWPPASLKSIQELIRGWHQCLVAEVHFDPDPIPQGATPAASDNLAQRNLAISESDNPGSLATHTVQHTFELKAALPVPVPLFAARPGLRQDVRTPSGPDELMILWNDVPRASRLLLYMPDVDAAEVVRTAARSYEAPRLEQVDEHTLLCLPGDVTYVPLPMGRTRNIPGLLTLELPDGVRRGQEFRLVVRQISGQPRTILGSFQLAIPVSGKQALLEPEIRRLSVLRHIFLAIPVDDPWRAVFVRYIDQVARRVEGFGGTPAAVQPSADGSGRDTQDGGGREWVDGGGWMQGGGGAAEDARCARDGLVFPVLLALLVVAAGLHTATGVVAAIAAAAAAAWWQSRCAPGRCAWASALLAGLVLGMGVLALLLLAGVATANGTRVLMAAAVAAALAASAGLWWRCFPLARRAP